MLIQQLGCDRYECRTLAREELQSMGTGAHVALAWGSTRSRAAGDSRSDASQVR